MWARSLLLVAGSALVAGCFLTLDADDFTRGGAPADAASGDAGAPVIADASPADGGGDAAQQHLDASSPCPDGVAGHCYFLLAEEQPQEQARAACGALGAHLVTIGSAAEQAEVGTLAAGKIRWIGLEATATPPNSAADFAWLTGEPTTYENWFPGNPMDHESCVAISSLPDQHWIDRACSDRYVAICEVDR